MPQVDETGEAYAARNKGGRWDGIVWVPDPKPRPIIELLGSMGNSLKPPNDEEWKLLKEEFVKLGQTRFLQTYFSAAGQNRLLALEQFSRKMDQIESLVRLDAKKRQEAEIRQKAAVNQPAFYKCVGTLTYMGCGHQLNTARIRDLLERSGGNPVNCILCDKPSDYKKLRLAIFGEQK